MSTPHTRIDDSVPPRPQGEPATSIDTQTDTSRSSTVITAETLRREDTSAHLYEWLLDRFTAPEWTVKSLSLETNDHTQVNSTPVLEGTLTHDSGALIQIHPNDPDHTVGHGPGFPIYDHHRVRLRESTDTAYYVTPNGLDSLSPIPVNTSPQNTHPHPIENAKDSIELHEQAQVHHSATTDQPTPTAGKQQFSIESRLRTIQTVYGAAHHITASIGQQTGLNAFETN